MNLEVVVSLMIFVLVSTITPGPNNLLLTASGLNFGFRSTLPHVLGIHCGVYLLVILCAFGLGSMLLAEPKLILLLKVFGSAYLAYLAWKIIGLEIDKGSFEHKANPLSVRQAFIFQFSNPKAWFMATTGLNIALPLSDSMSFAALYLCLGFGTLGLLCNLLWVGMGYALQNLFAQSAFRYIINGTFAVLTVLTILMIWLV